jgi:hypothetical protein
VFERERERMKEVWERLKKEQKALTKVKEEMSKLMARGTTNIWRLKSRMSEQLREYKGKIAAAAAEDHQSREARERMAKEREKVMEAERSRSMICQGCNRQGCRSAAGRAMGPSSAAARVTPAEAMGRSPLIMRSKDGMTLSAVVRSGTGASEAQALRPFSDSRMVKLLSTGGQMCLCLQLHTENGVATWRQTDVPNNGQSGILLMPIKKTPQQFQTDPSAMERQAAQTRRGPGAVEVVLRGVSKEPEGRTKELILYTCQATGKQSGRYRYQTGDRNRPLALKA